MDYLFGMHITEGFLPIKWAIAWTLLMVPFFVLGVRRITTMVNHDPKALMLIAFAGAFTFAMSALKLPSVSGSCSHPTGVGLGAIMFGPLVMVVIGLIVLLFQAVLLAHGGITTLGANVFSMAIVGTFISYGVYRVLIKAKLSKSWAAFLGAALGSFSTYMVTALQLALAHPSPQGGYYLSWIKFTGVFAVTQIPISMIEGIITVMVFNLLWTYSTQEMQNLVATSSREGI